MKRGNEIHDELFEGEGVDVAVEDAVNMAGALCFVNSVGQGYDMFGHDCEDQLATVFEMLCTTQQSRCYAVVSSGRTMLLIVNEDGSCMIVSQAYKSWSCDCLLPFKLSQDAGQVAAGNDAKNLANRFKILFCDTYFLCNTIVSFLCGSRGVGY